MSDQDHVYFEEIDEFDVEFISEESFDVLFESKDIFNVEFENLTVLTKIPSDYGKISWDGSIITVT